MPDLPSSKGLIPFLFGACALLSPREVGASDAYDDEATSQPPRPYEQDGHERRRDEDTLSAGGLDAPEAMPEAGDERSQVEKELDHAEEEDAGRGLSFVWVDGTLGYQYVNVTAFSDKNFVDQLDTTASAFSFGGGAGIRLLYFSLGARFRLVPASVFQLWTMGAELALRIPYGALEPYASVGAGYAHLGGLSSDTGERITRVRGLDLRFAFGLDYYLSQTFSIGGQFSFDYLSLTRPSQDSDLCSAQPCVYESKGKARGFSLSPSLVLAVHF